MMKKYNKGFTLIELMAVVVILGILTTIVAINVAPFLQRANFEKVRADLSQIQKGIETYNFQHSAYPTTDDGLEALIKSPMNIKNPNLYPKNGYLSGYVPEDPWGNQYLYLNPGQYGRYDLFTYGADGVAGGEGENADIGNWQK